MTIPKDPGFRRTSSRLASVMTTNSYLLPLVVVLVLSIVIVPQFLTVTNVSNMLANMSVLAVIGFGSTLVVALRGLDLSVGAVQALSACTAAVTAASVGTTLGAGLGLLIGTAAGILNGVLISYARLPAFVVTLGMMSLARGAALIVSGGSSVRMTSTWLTDAATAQLGPVPVLFLFAVTVGLIFFVLLSRTVFGRHILAVGGSREAAVDSGINVGAVTLAAYAISGFSAALGGLMLLGQLGSASGVMGQGLELQVIAVVVLGGTALTGGYGSIPGTFAAAFLMAMINSALNLLNVPSFYQYLAIGLVLLGALWLESIRRSVLVARAQTLATAAERK